MAEALAQGDLTARADLNTTDDVGAMGAALDSATDHLRDLVASVAESARQVASSSEELSASSQQTSASAQEIAASAQHLAQTAATLEELVGRFTLVA